MDDVISRQGAIDAIHSAIFDFFDIVEDDSESPITYKDEKLLEMNKAITKRIRQLPSAERTGRWTHVYDENEKLFFRNKWVCSACGESNTYGMSDFCPCCGAMMENSTRLMKEAEE